MGEGITLTRFENPIFQGLGNRFGENFLGFLGEFFHSGGSFRHDAFRVNGGGVEATLTLRLAEEVVVLVRVGRGIHDFGATLRDTGLFVLDPLDLTALDDDAVTLQGLHTLVERLRLDIGVGPNEFLHGEGGGELHGLLASNVNGLHVISFCVVFDLLSIAVIDDSNTMHSLFLTSRHF
jgi:hypothetical protein